MPLTKLLPTLRNKLRSKLASDLGEALEALKELFDQNPKKHRDVLQLLARLNDINKQSSRGVIA